jgi:hypothetical protein
MDIAFNPARDNFTFAMMALGKLNQAGNKQFLVLHQAEHGCLL